MAPQIREAIARVQGLHGKLADALGNPNLVWCRSCGREQGVDAAECLASGWPSCCGNTMTIDRPGQP
jgi:hypothetical protein